MKHLFLKISLLLLSLISLNACQKVIQIDLNSSNAQYVIIGNIADFQPCVVTIAQTVNFSDASNYPPVTGATVTLSDNFGSKETLTETKSGTYETSKTFGMIGHTYTLTVLHNGKIFTAVSTMADDTPLLDIKFLPTQFSPNGPGSKDTLPFFTAVPIHTDQVNVKNFYRYIQTINGVVDSSFLIRNDVFNDGKINAQPIFSRKLPHLGDNYSLKMENIDESTYTYFYSLNQSSGNGPGGGTTPANPPTNISGGALGYFSAYSQSQLTVLVK
jgi:Domain of unknown function (DUF4249)